MKKFPATHTKICSICKEELLLESFSVDKQKKIGRTSSCKKCQQINYRSKHPMRLKKSKEVIKLQKSIYYKKNKISLSISKQKWREENWDKVLSSSKEYYSRNRNKVLKRQKLNNKVNKKVILEKSKERAKQD